MARFTKREIQKFIKADGISVTAAEQLRLLWAYCLERRRCHGSNPCLTPAWGIRSSAPPIISPLPWCHRPKKFCVRTKTLSKKVAKSDFFKTKLSHFFHRLRYGNGEYVKACQERIKQKSSENHPNKMIFGTFGPSVEIRTQGLLNPIQARYQTSPHPDAVSNSLVIIPWGEEKSKRVLKKRGKYMHNFFAVFRSKIG